MTLHAAFYTGTQPGLPGLYNRLARYLDNGPFSHSELVFDDGVSASSSWMDGGVRFKRIGFSSGQWAFLRLPDAWAHPARQWYQDHEGHPYDLWGQIRFGLGFVQYDSPGAWFCSESNVAALAPQLGMPRPVRYGPNGAYELLVAAGGLAVAQPW